VNIQQVLDEGATAVVTGVASDDRAVTSLTVSVGFSGPYVAELLDDPAMEARRWRVEVPLAPTGPAQIVATAHDGGGRFARDSFTLERPVPAPGDAPILRVDVPIEGHSSSAPAVVFSGTTLDPLGVSRVEVNGVSAFFGAAESLDHFQTWTKTVPLRAGANERFEVIATNAAGQRTVITRRVRSLRAPPHGPPTIGATEPADHAVVAEPAVVFKVAVHGAADPETPDDAVPIGGVEVRVDGGPWARAERADGLFWQVQIRIGPGHHVVEVLAHDIDGLQAVANVQLSNADDRWGDGPLVRLRPAGPPGGLVELALDRAGLAALFAGFADEITLFTVEAGPVFARSLTAIRAACGPDWRAPDFVPACPEAWGPAELGAWRALTRTPRSADWLASSLSLAALTTEAILGEAFGAVIAPALGAAGADTPLLPLDGLTEALISEVLLTHPQSHDGLTFTLGDAIDDGAGLGDRMGAQDGHPGVLGGATVLQVLAPDAQVRLVIDSNLRVYEGVDLEAAQRAFFSAPSAGEPVAVLDFEDPAWFSIEGLLAPTVQFDLLLNSAGPAPLAALTVGDAPDEGAVWQRPRWAFERVAALTSLRANAEHRYGCDHCAGPEAGATVRRDPSGRVDLFEATVGRLGYDCVAGACTRARATPPGVAEHMSRLDQGGCARRIDCAAGEVCARSGRDDDRGQCVAAEAVACQVDAPCAPGLCLAGACVPAAQIECRSDAACGDGTLCHAGRCEGVPAGWLRLWVAGDASAPPLYVWDLLAELVGAEIGGPVQARFASPAQALDFDAVQLEAAIRGALHGQREAIAQQLLGALPAQGARVDLYLDHDDNGGVWLLVSGCSVEGVACDGPSDGRLHNGDGAAIDLEGPGGRRGLPLSAVEPGLALYLVRDAARQRFDVHAVGEAREEITLWLRPAE
jgi:hypothetical protein